MRISFEDSPDAQEKALREEINEANESAIAVSRKLSEMRGRINQFISKVDSVCFSGSMDDAELWMLEWGAFLLSGRQPEPQPAEDVGDFDPTDGE